MNPRICIVLISLLFYCGTLFSQEKDSLESLSYDDLKIAYFSNKNSDSDKALFYAKEVLNRAIKEQNTKEKTFAYLLLSDIQNRLGNYTDALQLADSTILYADRLQNQNIKVRGLKVKSSIFRNLGAYKAAIEINLLVKKIAEETKNSSLAFDAKHNIGLIKNEIGTYEEAIQIFTANLDAISSLPKINQKKSYVNTIIALASAYTNINAEKTRFYTNTLKKIAENDNNQIALGYYYMFEGKIAYKKGDFESALQLMNSAEEIFTALGYERNLFTVYRFKGKCYYELLKFEEAIVISEKAKKIKKVKQFHHIELLDLYWLLEDSYKKVGQIDSSDQNSRLARSLVIKNDLTKTAIYKLLKEKYDIANFKIQIDELTTTSEQEKKYSTILTYIGAFLFIALLLFSIRYFQLKKRNQSKFKKLMEHIEVLETKDNNIPTINKKETEQKISDEKALVILKALEEFELKEKYLDPKTSLTSVAKKINTNTSYLSKTINTYKGQTFINYITSLRITYVLRRLKNDKVFRSYSIKGIAEEVGFKSEGSFSRAFKKQTGIYPSYFIKNITANS
ncbi:helix-turn-helix transcriptional regulator [Kordia jejudonensis]|uniref:helix-turn-helix transcriptional regulator n=1 Tax=Kordia jejudonensis TaxID=1348245 RepID=UPI000629774F|nr:helix-turn-helix transcriptional regulator [Kordia jejudonensis]